MKYKAIAIYILLALAFFSCKKDLGNYKYHPPSEPEVINIQDKKLGAVLAVLGDTLVLRPYVELDGADPYKDLTFLWEIYVSEAARTDTYEGYPLKFVYNLGPGIRNARLTVSDKRNGMKYFIPFKISGSTQFSHGMAVLSVDNGTTKLSFVKSDSINIVSNLYFKLHGENLPSSPVQLFGRLSIYNPDVVDDYWVVCNDPGNPGVVIDANTMLRKRYFKDQFFIPPTEIVFQGFESAKGFATGIINDKLYLAITSTAPFAEDWGKFSNPQLGDYKLSKYYGATQNFYFGFDKKAKAFVSFNNTGGYSGTEYDVFGTAFDPKKVGMSDLLFMQPVPGNTHAFFKADDGKILELSFNIEMDNYISGRAIRTYYKRPFKGASLIDADTKWQRSGVDIFYFTSNDKIYRYNPINQDLRMLDIDFQGQKITMLKLIEDGTRLVAGINGQIFILDVSVGVNGRVTRVIDNIPGSPIDFVFKN
jgi:hypothetical protein